MERVLICDSTLRDGEQAPNAGMTFEQKIELGQSLMKLGVDVLEAGFAQASPLDAKVIYHLSQRIQSKNIIISSLARCCERDIDTAIKALSPAIRLGQGRIHLFIATSQKHLEGKLKKDKEEILQTISKTVQYARKRTKDVQWTAEDATRSDTDFVAQCAQKAIDAGATTINFADTVGQMVDTQMQKFFETVISKLQYPPETIFSVHCHDDKGLATANSLFAIKGGARQVECCVNGLGERGGNAALEEIVMTILTTPECYPFMTNIDPKKIMLVSKMVEKFSGFLVPKNKAIVGKNAFLHASGIHQDGIIKAKQNGIKIMYSSIDPEILGCQDEIIITRHSGTNGIISVLKDQGITVSFETARWILNKVKQQTDHPKGFTTKELMELYQGYDVEQKNP